MDTRLYAVTVPVSIEAITSLYGARRAALLLAGMLTKINDAILRTEPHMVMGEDIYCYQHSEKAYFSAVSILDTISGLIREETRSIPVPVKCAVLSTDEEEDMTLAHKITEVTRYVATQGKGPVIIATEAFVGLLEIGLKAIPVEFYLRDNTIFRGYRLVFNQNDLLKTVFFPGRLSFYDGQYCVLVCSSSKVTNVTELINRAGPTPTVVVNREEITVVYSEAIVAFEMMIRIRKLVDWAAINEGYDITIDQNSNKIYGDTYGDCRLMGTIGGNNNIPDGDVLGVISSNVAASLAEVGDVDYLLQRVDHHPSLPCKLMYRVYPKGYKAKVADLPPPPPVVIDPLPPTNNMFDVILAELKAIKSALPPPMSSPVISFISPVVNPVVDLPPPVMSLLGPLTTQEPPESDKL